MSTNKPRTRKRYSIVVTTTESKSLQANHVKLYEPKLTDLKKVVENGLKSNFKNVKVSVIDCPDLKEWGVASSYLGGNTRLADVGGVPYLFHPGYQHITFQIPDIIKTCGSLGPCLVFGAAAASSTVVGKNSELIPNTRVPGPRYSRYAKMDKQIIKKENNNNMKNEKQYIEPKNDISVTNNLEEKETSDNDMKINKLVPSIGFYPSEQTGCLANLYICDGQPCKVLYVKASVRKGKKNLISCIRESLLNLKECGGKKQVGLGGIIKVNKGKIKSHIMNDFLPRKTDFKNSKLINDWLEFFEVGPNLLMFSTILSDDPMNGKLHLRLEHTHFYSLDKNNTTEAGHYHEDTTPDIIEYEGYFNTAEYIYRIEDAFYNLESKGSKYWT